MVCSVSGITAGAVGFAFELPSIRLGRPLNGAKILDAVCEEVVFEAEEPVGRKMDFILQELNREANTMGSKSNDADLTRTVVDIKAELEKIREQIQNIE